MTRTITKSMIFKAAWNLARQATAKFGGVARVYFAEALRIAHTEAKAFAKQATKVAKVEMTTTDKVNSLATIILSWPRAQRKGFVWSFVADNADRVAKYGNKTMFSEKQAKIINDLYVQYAA